MNDTALSILRNGTVIPAVPLALDESRRFDEKRQRALIRYYLACGVGGLAVAVHTTQFEIRKPEFDLFETVCSVVIDEVCSFEKETGKTIVKVGGVCGKTPQTMAEAGILKNLGYDAILLSPGGLADLSEDELVERTRDVAALIPVVGFYLQPAVGGRILSAEYWKKISDIPGLVAIKCAPFNRYQTYDLVRGVAMSDRRNEIALYTGNDDAIIIDLISSYSFDIDGKNVKLRFVGGLLGHWAVWTKKVVEIFDEIKLLSDNEPIPLEILELANKITDANAAFFDVANNFKGCIAGIHEVLRRQGLFTDIWCLNPAETLSKGQSAEIDRVYAAYPELNDDDFIKENLIKWL